MRQRLAAVAAERRPPMPGELQEAGAQCVYREMLYGLDATHSEAAAVASAVQASMQAVT